MRKLVVFDVDGTPVDNRAMIRAALAAGGGAIGVNGGNHAEALLAASSPHEIVPNFKVLDATLHLNREERKS